MLGKDKEKKCTPASILRIGLACTPLGIKPDIFSGTSCVLEVTETAVGCWEKFKQKSKSIPKEEFIRPSNFGYNRRFEIPHEIPREHFRLDNFPKMYRDLDLLDRKLEKERKVRANVNKIIIEVKCNNCNHIESIEVNFVSKGQKEFICKECSCKNYFII